MLTNKNQNLTYKNKP